MSKYDIWSYFEGQNRILNVKIRYLALFRGSRYRILNVKIRKSALVECQNRILNVKIHYSASVRKSKKDFECQNTICGPISHVEIVFFNVKLQHSARF